MWNEDLHPKLFGEADLLENVEARRVVASAGEVNESLQPNRQKGLYRLLRHGVYPGRCLPAQGLVSLVGQVRDDSDSGPNCFSVIGLF